MTIRTKIDEAPGSIARGVYTYSDPTRRHCEKERSGVSTKGCRTSDHNCLLIGRPLAPPIDINCNVQIIVDQALGMPRLGEGSLGG